MAARKHGMMFRMPSAEEEADMAMEHAVDKAILCHPQTKALRKQIAGEMRRAAKGGASASKSTPRKRK